MEKISGYQRYFAFIQPVVHDPLVRVYFSLTLSFFLTAFLIVFALSPTVNTILSLQKKITDEEKIITALDAKISALVTAGENYNQLAPQLILLDRALPDGPRPQDLTAVALTAASQSGVAVNSLQFKAMPLTLDAGKPDLLFNVPVTGFSLTAAGSKEQLRSFLGRLENNLRLVLLEKMTAVFGGANGATVDSQAAGFYFL